MENAAVSPQVVMPEASDVRYTRRPGSPDEIEFTGTFELRGIALAYWDAHYPQGGSAPLSETQPRRTLLLRFYPNRASMAALPEYEVAGRREKTERIFIYRERRTDELIGGFVHGYPEEEVAEIRAAVADFESLPEGFLERKEGYALQPASVVLEDLVSFIEGSHRFTYARVRDLAPIAGAEADLDDLPDAEPHAFLGRPWEDYFAVKDEVPLRAAPGDESAELFRVEPSSFPIRKLRTAEEGWVRVSVPRKEGENVEGYLRASQLWLID